MKIADIDTDKLSEGSGRCPKNPQGTSPLTHYRALPEPYPRRKAGKGIDAFVENKVFAVLFGNEGIATVWAAKFYGGKPAILWREACSADFAEDLAFGTVVFIEVRFGGIASGAGAVIGDVTIGAPGDGTDLLAITFFVVRDEVFVIPVLTEVGDQRKLVNLELLVFWGVGIIKSPLLERDVSADKLN